MKPLAKFILDYMKKNDWSASEFARQCGLSKTLINGILSDNPVEYPRVSTLVAIAELTGVSALSLFAMLDETFKEPRDLDELALMIMNMPKEKQEMLEALVRGMSQKR